jgi:ABC-type antimicrobial peptide transport system permease subunit
MFFLLGIWNGIGEIRAHKLRSMLTITCVLLGVASLVLIAAFITGLFRRWEVYSQEMGWAQKVQVDDAVPPDEQQHIAAISPGRTLADARAIERLSHYAAAVSPMTDVRGSMSFNGKVYSERVHGVTPAVLTVDRYEVARGRFITELDLERGEPVVVLGSEPVREIFKGIDPMDQIVQVNGQPFRVVGLLKHYEEMDGQYNILERKNRTAFVPITAAQLRISGNDRLDQLNVRVNDLSNLGRLVDEVNAILTRTHRGIKDFEAYTEQENIAELNAMRRNFFVVGCGIGAITLLVGGIGIMNLMLASINERVREIGIRKAIGAWNRDIFVQFIAESITLSAFGGMLGVGVGIIVVRMLRHAMGSGGGGMGSSPPVLSVPAVIIGLGFSVFVGVVAGLYPAFRASRLDPIEALRYE